MRNIASLTNKSKIKEAWAMCNALAYEPISTEQATQRAMKILDANYKTADLQAVLQDNCKRLNSTKKDKLIELLKKFEQLFDGTWVTGEPSLSLFN